MYVTACCRALEQVAKDLYILHMLHYLLTFYIRAVSVVCQMMVECIVNGVTCCSDRCIVAAV